MLFAIFIALGHSVVPHHEHGYEIHVSTKCSSECADSSGCISQIEEAILQTKEDNECACGSHDNHFSVPEFALLSVFLSNWIPLKEDSTHQSISSLYSNFYTSSHIPDSKGLRAPPVLFS